MSHALHGCRGPGIGRRGADAGRASQRRVAGSSSRRPPCAGRRGSPRRVCRCTAGVPALDTFLADTGSADALRSAAAVPFSQALLAAAASVRDAHYGSVLTFSPKVFIPLTRLCRDKCSYCTFVQEPREGARAFLTLAEVLAIARAGAAEGATEALFTLGDAPELVYEVAARELASMGHASTVSYLCEAAAAVLTDTGLLPHINAGLLTQEAAEALRAVSVSQGLMLESTSDALLSPGGAHAGCVTKAPALRLASIHAAGAARVPFTSGILIGIGESRADRLHSLVALRDAHAAHGHIQEVIIQNFRAKGATHMAHHPEPTEEELLWTVAMARLVLPPEVSIQAPPNLQRGGEDAWKRLISAGINDWGGISTVTRDHVNPEARWPELDALAAACHAVGFSLVPRLAVYPRFLHAREKWLDTRGGALSVAAAALRASDAAGLARMHPFVAGAQDSAESHRRSWRMTAHGAVEPAQQESTAVPDDMAAVMRRCADGDALLRQPLSLDETELLFHARGDAFDAVCAAADALREAVCGDVVTYVVNRNVNYSDVCTYGCTFCAFSKTNRREAYLVPPSEVARRALEAWQRGATEVCLQGGIHPEFTGDTYLRYVDAVKSAVPDMHVHAFSPLEVRHGAGSLGMPVPAYLRMLKAAGLASLPGTAAEILDESVRRILCPDKLSTAEWCDVIAAAHGEGLTTTSTCMFGHCERGYAPWATHLAAIRRLAVASPGRISEFVPLPFVAQHAPLFRSGLARVGPSLRECVLMHAVARLALHGAVRNVQCSWVKIGPANAALLLRSGANDMGGTLMNESISRAAGAAHGQELLPEAMEAIIAAAGRPSRQRTTLYGVPPEAQTRRSFGAPPLSAVANPPAFV